MTYDPKGDDPMSRQSRPARWNEALLNTRNTYKILRMALEDLEEIRGEYEEWRDNLPESLQSSPTADKLDEVCNLDIESVLGDVESLLDEAEGLELPLGFGRD
jgi:hypothetical protein